MKAKELNIPWTQLDDFGLKWNGQRLPEPYKEIERDEFDLLMYCGGYGLVGTFFNQIQHDEQHWSAHYFWFPFYGLCVLSQYGKQKTGIWLKQTTTDDFGYNVRYFKVGCTHTWRAITKEECDKRDILHFGYQYHVSECTKCGVITAVDSSG